MPIPRKAFIIAAIFGFFPWYSKWVGFDLSPFWDTTIQFLGLVLSLTYTWYWNHTQELGEYE
jgi:hypothetical protein